MSIYVDIEKTLGCFQLKVKFEAGNETLALLGASGCGKTMTLKCIAGVEKPDRGKIVLDGRVLFDSERNINLPPQVRCTGLLFQNYALFPNMTVQQNIQCGAARSQDKGEQKKAVEQAMEDFGISELAHRYPHQLSGGQQQRVALARLLVSEPQILLLDEPFSALDSHLRFRLEQELHHTIRSFGKTVLLVSHDRDEVYRMSDRIAIMDHGTIQRIGPKKSVFSDPVTANGAALTGCKNISPVKILDTHHINALDWGITLKLANRTEGVCAIGIRMHDIRHGAGENCVSVRVLDEIENPFSYTVMVVPEGKGTAHPIGWELSKEQWQTIRSNCLIISLPPEAILPLREPLEKG